MEMRQCNYCSRVFEKKYETCPSCGANSFNILRNVGTKIITTPPKGGYTIPNKETSKKIFFIVLLVMGIICFISFVPFFLIQLIVTKLSEEVFSLSSILMMGIPALIVFIALIVISIVGLVDRKGKKRREHLVKNGVLIKNMEYTLVDSNVVINDKPVKALEVIYENKSGVKVPLKSEAKFTNDFEREDGKVDLLIDPDDCTNYYIGIDIY